MKKALLITTLLLVFFLTTGIASARVFFRLGVFPPAVIDPPVIVAPLRPITRILTAITARDIMVIGCGFPAIGTIYGPVTVGRKCGIQGTGVSSLEAEPIRSSKLVLLVREEVVFSEGAASDRCLKTRRRIQQESDIVEPGR